jgi:integrase
MGVYRREKRRGEPAGPWIIQYPKGVDPRTGKIRYTSEKIGHSKRMADLAFGRKMLEWEKKKHLGLEKKEEYLFRELVEWYLKLPVAMKKKSFNKDEQRSEILKDHFGLKNAREIKPAMIEMFQHEMMTKPREGKKRVYKPATVNRMLALMKRIYNLAIREEMVERNPCFKVSMLPENNKRDRVITHAQFEAIIANLPKHAADIVTTAYHTGMRAGEIFNLTWDRVNTKEGFIELTAADTKTAEPRRIYFNDDLKALFKELGKVRRIRHKAVFTYRGQPIGVIRTSFNEACAKAGVKDFRVHDLRHTFNTNMRKAGVDRSVIMKITGHKTTAMFDRYNTVDSEDARTAMDRYEGFLRSQITSGLLHALPEGKKEGRPERATP